MSVLSIAFAAAAETIVTAVPHVDGPSCRVGIAQGAQTVHAAHGQAAPPSSGSGGGQEPSKPPRPEEPGRGERPDAPASGDAGGGPIADDNATAAKRLREAEKALADREPRLRAKALEPFLLHRHESYVKRLAASLKDRNDDVALMAAKALANQTFAATTETLLDFACDEKKLAARPEVCAEAIRSLGAVGLGKRGYDRLRERFLQGDERVKGALCLAFAAAKEKRSFSFLVDQFNAPQPANRDDPGNPPESYWRARHEEWAKYSMHARKALKELTGEKFDTAKEWKEWAAGPGKAKGFIYKTGQ
jgi:hypothetical protein